MASSGGCTTLAKDINVAKLRLGTRDTEDSAIQRKELNYVTKVIANGAFNTNYIGVVFLSSDKVLCCIKGRHLYDGRCLNGRHFNAGCCLKSRHLNDGCYPGRRHFYD